jgi:hypothetical protein
VGGGEPVEAPPGRRPDERAKGNGPEAIGLWFARNGAVSHRRMLSGHGRYVVDVACDAVICG